MRELSECSAHAISRRSVLCRSVSAYASDFATASGVSPALGTISSWTLRYAVYALSYVANNPVYRYRSSYAVHAHGFGSGLLAPIVELYQ